MYASFLVNLCTIYRISSEHNSATIRKIEEAIGEMIYSPAQIQSWWPNAVVSFFTCYVLQRAVKHIKRALQQEKRRLHQSKSKS